MRYKEVRSSTDLDTAARNEHGSRPGLEVPEFEGLGDTVGARGRLQDRLTGGMSRRDFLRLGSMGVAGSALATILPGATSLGGLDRAEATTASVALGSFTPSLPWSFHETDAFSEMVGQKQAIIHWFQDWVMSFDAGFMNAAVSRGGRPLISWEPWVFGGGLDQPGYALRRIIAGEHDQYIRRWAQAAAAWAKPFFLRFAHEMNGDWTTWSPGVNGNTSREYRRAWRRVHNIFRQAGATNVRWVWAPVAKSEVFTHFTPYKDVYPGDAYVNWLGISGYNWGDTRAWSRWQSFSDVFGPSYGAMKRLAPKPIMIPEVGCAEQGGKKATWIQNAYLKQIPDKFPRIKAIVWFNANKENDWRVDSSSGALEAYKEVAARLPYAKSMI